VPCACCREQRWFEGAVEVTSHEGELLEEQTPGRMAFAKIKDTRYTQSIHTYTNIDRQT
jgi:hypothetical protein